MSTAYRSLLAAVLSLGLGLTAGCATSAELDTVPSEVWSQLESNGQVDLIVAFDDAAILDQASKLKKAKGILFDDDVTLRFKAKAYANMKNAAMSGLPEGAFEVLKDYDSLPLMFVRFRSVQTLNAILGQPSVLGAYENGKEGLFKRKSEQ